MFSGHATRSRLGIMQSLLNSFSSIRKALKLVWHSSPRLTLFSTILVFFQGTLPLFSLYFIKLIVDTITTALATPSPETVWSQVFLLIILTGGIAILIDALNALAGFLNETQSQIVTDYIQNRLHSKSIEVDLEYYENAQYYNTLHQAQEEAPYRPTLILNRLVAFAQNSLSLSAIALLLLSLHWGVTLVLFLTVAPLFLVRLRYSKKLYRQWQTWAETERRAHYFSTVLTQDNHAKEIRLFNLGQRFQEQYNSLRKLLRQEKITLFFRRFRAEAWSQSGANVAIFIALGFIAYQTLNRRITLGDLVMYYQAFQKGQGLLRDAVRNLASLYENSLFLDRFYQFLQLQGIVREPEMPQPIPQPLRGELELRDVSFHYPHNTRPVLEQINLKINSGETIALVGENGAGKTTLVKLLCRLYDPVTGKITLDGIDLRHFKIDDFRQHIGVVFQDYNHYYLTVKENIGLGDLAQLEREDKIIEAAKLAGVDRAIAKLPHAYETPLGTQFQQGEELSIGEWQKIAIARCFFRQSPIIIVDEPTSAIDPKSEAEILQQLRRLTEQKTAIIISHRLSTVKFADRIVVLEKGKIVEMGSHAELIQMGGVYAYLFKKQAQSYLEFDSPTDG